MAGADFASVLEITLFCSALFLAGLFCKRVRQHSWLVGHPSRAPN